MIELYKKLRKFNDTKWTVCYFVFSAVNILVLLFNPMLSEKFIDSIVTRSFDGVKFWAVCLILILILGQIVGYFLDYSKGMSERENWTRTISNEYEIVKFYDPKKTNINSDDIHQQFGQTYELIKDYYMVNHVNLFVFCLEEIAIIFILARISIINAILVGAFIPIFLLTSNNYGKKLAEYTNETIESMEVNRNYIADVVFTSFSERYREKSFFKPFSNYLDIYKENKRKEVISEAFFSNFLSYAFLNLIIVLSLIISGIYVTQGKMTLGELYAVVLYVSRFWSPMESIIGLYKDYSEKKMLLKKYCDHLYTGVMKKESNDIERIELKNYVSLDEKEKDLHKPIDVFLEKGNVYVVVGDNGVGKTSMMLSIMGMSNRYKGEITPRLDSCNKNFMYSLATPIDSDYFEHKEIDKPSMGQKKMAQLMKDFEEKKTVYIFDEPTNYLDDKNKSYVIDKIINLKRSDRIIIAVSHDEELISRADYKIQLS